MAHRSGRAAAHGVAKRAPSGARFAVCTAAWPNPKDPHTLADHKLGTDLAHVHDGVADHDHDDFEDGPLEDNPLFLQDHVSLTSVGIDIGSAGTQVIFSKVDLRRMGEDLSSRYFVVNRETLLPLAGFAHPVPKRGAHRRRKASRLSSKRRYGSAGVTPHDIDTGVVILTGEALRRDNAQAIAGMLAEQGGEFVCATAGHHMEAMLAAYGSGAARISSDQGKRILNIDIGGGTTKLALVEQGRVLATAAVHIGGRLQVVDETGRITRLDPAGHASCRAGRLHMAQGRPRRAARDGQGRAIHGRRLIAAIRMRPLPHAAGAALSHGTDRRARPHRRHHGVGRRRRIRLRPRGPRLRRHGPPARPRAAQAARRRRAALAAAAGRRVHPRHRARRLGIQRAALRQHQHHHQSRRAAAAPQSPGAAAALCVRGDDRS